MPKRKHYATILKERCKDLEQEVERLRRGTSQPDYTELKQAIDADVIEFDANTVANALLNQVCIPLNCREDGFIMEEGRHIRVQPFRLTDSVFKVVSSQMLQRVLDETKIDAVKYEREDWDCEDFARALVNRCVNLGINSVGRVFSWIGGHSFCVAVVQDGGGVRFEFIEPQTDRFVRELRGQYDLTNALIIIS